MREKRVFMYIILGFVFLLMLSPVTVTFNEILTKIAERFSLYLWIQEMVVPWEVRIVTVILRPFGMGFEATREGLIINGTYAKISWNCIGWQSLLLLLVTFLVGLRGNYTLISKLETILIGLLGTFFLNLLRITFTVILLFLSRSLFAIVFHDYLAALMTVAWLIFFWWFSYSFVLEAKGEERIDRG